MKNNNTKWIYKIESINKDYFDQYKLNEFGENGWELVSIIRKPSIEHINTCYYDCIFKKEKYDL